MLANADKYYSLLYPQTTLADYADGHVLLCEYADIVKHAQSLQSQHREDLQILFEDGVLCRGLDGNLLEFADLQAMLEKRCCAYLSQFLQGTERVPFRKIISIEAQQTATWGGEIRLLLEDLQEYTSQGYRVVLAAGSEKTLPILCKDLQESGIRCAIAQEDDLCPPGAVLLTARQISATTAVTSRKP